MIPLRLADVADVVGGELLDHSRAGTQVTRVTIDSRAAGPGTLFIALRGESADGHDFVADALGRGAAGALVQREVGAAGTVLVDDAGDALLGLGAWVRTEVNPTVVAVTGSSGKTTTKDLIRGAVSVSRRVVANLNSYNNELGVPLTCCELAGDTQVLVSEVGARGVGHIAAMATILRPDVAVVTNVGAAHLEMFADLAGVARAKGELVEALDSDGVAVLNADDPLVLAMAENARGRVLTYGLGEDAQLRATDVELDSLARPAFSVAGVRVDVPLPGVHNVSNALAALAAAEACGIAVAAAAEGLGRASVSRWRMELLEAPAGFTVINDAYNANPSSMTAALKTLAGMATQGRRWAVLGHMAELGSGAAEAHRRIGRLCAQLSLDGLLVVGPLATPILDGAREAGFRGAAVSAEHPREAVRVLGDELRAGDVVLVKASRSVGLERVALAVAERDAA